MVLLIVACFVANCVLFDSDHIPVTIQMFVRYDLLFVQNIACDVSP